MRRDPDDLAALLADYERRIRNLESVAFGRGSRGEFTPVVTGTSANNTGAGQFGYYVRVGHHVDISARWVFGSGSAMGNPASLSGLPFPVRTTGDDIPGFLWGYVVGGTGGTTHYPAVWMIEEGETQGLIARTSSPWTTITPANPINWDIGNALVFTGSYLTD